MTYPELTAEELRDINLKWFEETKANMADREFLRAQMEFVMNDPLFLELAPFNAEPSMEEVMSDDPWNCRGVKRWVMTRAVQEGLWHPGEPII